jgi:multiple sugar transport system ATP-binding protein
MTAFGAEEYRPSASSRDVVLDGVSLSVDAARLAGSLFGPSGLAGKTVLLRLIAGVIEPDAGTGRIGGRGHGRGAPPEDRGIGMAFQNFALFPHLSAFDNIASPLEARLQTAST